ncbi:MAG: MFS transporter [Deltaproteobacteria bacterium]|nr:MFS transporter [Deltaproteobacteria bacterium]
MKIKTYQNTIAILFALTWGLVILDRQAITFLFPILMETFGLNNAQTGKIVLVTGLGFVISSLFLTPLSDRSGLKKLWLVPVIISAGVFSGGTAFAASLMAMFIVRFLTGFADGPVYPLMTSILTVQGDPKKFASYIGLMQFSIGVIAMILGPTLTIQLAVHLNWHYAFIFTSLPTVIVGIIIWFVLKEVRPVEATAGGIKAPEAPAIDNTMKWRDLPRIFAYRNCVLSYISNVLAMVGFWGVVSFGTTYWVNEGGLTLEQAGYMTSISGVVGLGWALVIPMILDRIGRKPSTAILTLYSVISMFIIYLDHGWLAKMSFILVIGCYGFLSVLYVAIICQESVPPAIAATTTAIGMAIGELFGTTIAPSILGSLGDTYGLRIIFLVGGITTLIAFFISFGLIETRRPKSDLHSLQ